ILLLNPNLLPINLGWRLGFFIGPVLGVIALYVRYVLPETPRWLMTHDRNDETERIVDTIEQQAREQGVQLIFFSNASVLHDFYDVPPDRVGVFFFPFALGNLAGTLLIRHLFDTVGRRKVITFTYSASGILLAISALLFTAGSLTAITQTLFW